MKKYLFIVVLFLVGCSPYMPSTKPSTSGYKASSGVAKLHIKTQIDENSVMVGEGSGFAVSRNVLITALHNLADPFTSFEVNGVAVNIKFTQSFGKDGIIVVVDELPIELPIYEIGFNPARGAPVVASGYIPNEGLSTKAGKVLSLGVGDMIVVQGMSGGPVTYKGKAVGTISAIMPSLGISMWEPLPYNLIKSVIKENPPMEVIPSEPIVEPDLIIQPEVGG